LAPQVFRHRQMCYPELFCPFPSQTLRVSSLSNFHHFHRLPSINFPPSPPSHIRLFSFSQLISPKCSLTPTLRLLSQPRPCCFHNGCGSDTIPSRGRLPLQEYTLCQSMSHQSLARRYRPLFHQRCRFIATSW
jgi:hypothetical protein